MEIIDLWFNKIDLFLIVLARVSGVFQIAPIFAGERTPIYIRAGFATLFSILITLVLPVHIDPLPTQLLPLVLGMAGEFILGFTIGFIIYLVFVAVQVAGQFIDMQMGFGIVNVLDPQSGIQMPLVGNFLYIIALLVFLGVNGHHLVLTALVKSYDFIPVMGFTYQGGLSEMVFVLFCGMFLTAMKIAIPVVITLVVTDIALGLVARTVPQMNVFIVGLPMKIMVGIFCLFTIMGIYVWVMTALFSQVFDQVDALFRFLGP